MLAAEDSVAEDHPQATITIPTPHAFNMQEVPQAQTFRDRVAQMLAGGKAAGTSPVSEQVADLASDNPDIDTVSPGSPLFTHLSQGLAYTPGSAVGEKAPSFDVCFEAFQTSPTNARSRMTPGARAWAKHSHRSVTTSLPEGSQPSPPEFVPSNITVALSESFDLATDVEIRTQPDKQRKKKPKKDEGWWGIPSGPVAGINERASAIFHKIYNNATWRNLHWLPHQVLVYEIRIAEGYGMRWSQDHGEGGESWGVRRGKNGLEAEWTFRGFLEPQMENGHEVGWRHPVSSGN